MKKKIVSIMMSLMLIILSGCGIQSQLSASEAAEDSTINKIQIVTTTFAPYDWALNIVGDANPRIDVRMLMEQGTDFHNYQPTAEDIALIGSCDLFIHVGGESDEWVEDVLGTINNPDMMVLNLLEEAPELALIEELVEGMEEDHDHDEEPDEHDSESHMYDEHVWLSMKNAITYTDMIRDKISMLDRENADAYEENYETYSEALSKLDQDYEEAMTALSDNVLIFGDRFPFRYLCEDYGLQYYAAFSGCSAETEASFETILFLAGKVSELGSQHIFTLEGSDVAIAKLIADNATVENAEILSLNSLQSVTRSDLDYGLSYVDVMTDNLKVLIQGLEVK